MTKRNTSTYVLPLELHRKKRGLYQMNSPGSGRELPAASSQLAYVLPTQHSLYKKMTMEILLFRKLPRGPGLIQRWPDRIKEQIMIISWPPMPLHDLAGSSKYSLWLIWDSSSSIWGLTTRARRERFISKGRKGQELMRIRCWVPFSSSPQLTNSQMWKDPY